MLPLIIFKLPKPRDVLTCPAATSVPPRQWWFVPWPLPTAADRRRSPAQTWRVPSTCKSIKRTRDHYHIVSYYHVTNILRTKLNLYLFNLVHSNYEMQHNANTSHIITHWFYRFSWFLATSVTWHCTTVEPSLDDGVADLLLGQQFHQHLVETRPIQLCRSWGLPWTQP